MPVHRPARRAPTCAPSLRDLACALAVAVVPLAAWHCKRNGAPAGGEPVTDVERYRRRAIATEAVDGLGRIARAMAAYASAEHMGRGTGGAALLPPQFPASAPLTPTDVPRGHRVVDPAGTWSHPTWQALDFAMSDPHYFSYQVVSDGQHFTARALGDLDSDGTFSTFERTGQIVAGGEAELTPLRSVRELE